MEKKNVLFITGAFVSHTCWDAWTGYFNAQGYEAVAPPWPFKDDTGNVLRGRQPYDSDLAALTLEELVGHYVKIAAAMPQKPIVIGHSLGGLIAQILVNRGLALAGVAIHPVPPQGVFPYEFTFLRATWKLLGLFSSVRRTHMVSFADFQRTFVNGLPLPAQLDAYDKYAIPESRTVARGGLTSAAAVNFKKPHAPLLITSGGRDQLIPVHLINRNYKKYNTPNSITDYREFPDSNHGILTDPSWKTEADVILEWLNVVL